MRDINYRALKISRQIEEMMEFGMKENMKQMKIKKFSTFLSVLLLLSAFTSVSNIVVFNVKTAHAADITTYSDSSSVLSVLIPGEEPPPPPPPPGLETKPRINWYDLQTKAGVSKLNSLIDVNQEYKFCISISSDQGWDDIEYIDITAWCDNGYDSTTYNQTAGGNLNLYLQYKNTTGTANYYMLWPDDEVTKGSFTEIVEADPDGIVGSTECRNMTFFFTPGYQFRYAPGDGIWHNTTNAFNDIWSWNFKISVKDSGENASGPNTVSVIDEFGVSSYTEIVIAGMPSIQGIPGNVSAISSVNITTRSNIDYSLSVDLFHFTGDLDWLSPTTQTQVFWNLNYENFLDSNGWANHTENIELSKALRIHDLSQENTNYALVLTLTDSAHNGFSAGVQSIKMEITGRSISVFSQADAVIYALVIANAIGIATVVFMSDQIDLGGTIKDVAKYRKRRK